jgi:predicted nucleic acid-binding protein
MRLVDSNIIIYATAPENEWLRTWLEVEPFAVSQISRRGLRWGGQRQSSRT